MKKLFIHQPFFRILSPIFSGVVVYLLLLLLNNNVEQLQEQFLGEELYVCIGLSYIVQELSRALLLVFKRIPKRNNSFLNLFFQVVISLLISVLVVTLSIILYYEYVVKFSASTEEIITFDSIFAVITLIYILLFVSHQYLYKINSEKLEQEELIKQNIEDEFRQFKRGINPHLLFESFEALIILMNQNSEKTDEFIDHLSVIYRYILSSKDRQLVDLQEELHNLKELENLFNKLPYRNILIEHSISSDFLVVPGSLLFLIELIVRNTIISSSIQLQIHILEKNDFLMISYKTQDKINSSIRNSDFEEIKRVYSIYNDHEIKIQKTDDSRIITLPKLTIKH
ncbi:histidine kinase [Pseudotenacibaculum sp. MALMAid0570]|uniref:histidine kinase n=1 Tax=Pseudotenacibaculum sp. MALMAid0570 TaxID=3143938 RepID=UPI0032DED03B